MRAQHLALFAALSAGFAAEAFAQDGDEPFDRTPEDCVSLNRVHRTHALDDQTILFFMGRDKVYRNYLPRKCPGLAQNNRFSYESTGGRLCSVDTVTVLEEWGGRLGPGFTCRLGNFHPISPEEIEDLEATLDGRKRRDAVEAEAVELPRAAPASGPEPAAPTDAPTDTPPQPAAVPE